MAKQKNYDGWCAKTKDGELLVNTFVLLWINDEVMSYDTDPRREEGASYVKAKLVEVK